MFRVLASSVSVGGVMFRVLTSIDGRCIGGVMFRVLASSVIDRRCNV